MIELLKDCRKIVVEILEFAQFTFWILVRESARTKIQKQNCADSTISTTIFLQSLSNSITNSPEPCTLKKSAKVALEIFNKELQQKLKKKTFTLLQMRNKQVLVCMQIFHLHVEMHKQEANEAVCTKMCFGGTFVGTLCQFKRRMSCLNVLRSE